MLKARLHIVRGLLLLLLLGMTGAVLGAGDSLRELRKLLLQQQQQQLEDHQLLQLQERQFHVDINSWARSLEQMGFDFMAFVEQCRPLGSHCNRRKVQRQLRALRRNYSDLHAQLETLEIHYVGKINSEELLTPTMQAVKQVLHQYDLMWRQMNAEAYKLVEQ